LNIENNISSGIIEQYVLGLCTNDEVREVEILRKQDAAFNKAITDFEIELEEKMLRHIFLPGVATDDKILSKLKELNEPITTSLLVPLVNVNEKQIAKVKRFSWAKLTSAAAVLLLCISAFVNYTQFQKNKEQAALLASKSRIVSLPENDYNILKDPSITPVAMNGQGYHAICRCTMFWDKKTGKAYVMVHHLVPSGDNYDYQLWANVNGKQVSVGMINDAIRDRFIEVSGMPEDAKEFIVTLEKTGGATVPDADVVLRGTV
jgi:anti-sigma-K factor RskA